MLPKVGKIGPMLTLDNVSSVGSTWKSRTGVLDIFFTKNSKSRRTIHEVYLSDIIFTFKFSKKPFCKISKETLPYLLCSSRPGVPNLLLITYHQMNIIFLAYHLFQSLCNCVPPKQPFTLKRYKINTRLFILRILRTTQDLYAYHQWYAYHRLGTPALDHGSSPKTNTF